LSWQLDRNTSQFTTVFNTTTNTAETQLQDAYASNLTASVTQQLLRGIKFKYNVQAVTDARANLGVAQLGVERQRQDVLQLAADAYWQWAYQMELVHIAEEAQAVADEALRVGKLQVESGRLAPVEGTRLEAAMVQARQDLLVASEAAEASANTLLVLIGADPTRAVVPASAPGDVPLLDLDAGLAIEAALSQNLDLAVARAELDSAKIALASAKHGMLPVLSATGTAGLGSNVCVPGSDAAYLEECEVGGAADAVAGVFENDNRPFVTGSGLFQVPLGNRATRGARDGAEALVQQRTSALETLERRVAADVENQVHSLASARQRMDLADANVQLALETLEAEEALVEAGRVIQKDVLEARTDVTRARAEAANARTHYRLAQTRLLQLQGKLTEMQP
jgi:outer membrane protein TolC